METFVESVGPGKSPASETVVPPPVEKVHLKHIESMPKLVVYFDLETTGLEADCDIVQLSSAVGQQYFNAYILPSKNISWKASEVTGLKCDSGSLYLKGKIVEALEPREALQKWLNWIRPVAPVVLIAHNCYNFDSRRLLNNYKRYGLLDELGQLVMGFIDTLPLFKELYPKMASYRQEELVTKILKESYDAHDSLADVQSLQKLVMKHNLNDKLLLKFSFTYQSLLEYIEYSKRGKENAASLQSLVDSKHLSRGMAETVGKSGLTLENLRQACVEGGKELLEKVLSEPTSSGQPRVTRNRSVLNKLHDFFSSER
ncbi:DNA polymerase III PolC-type-like [Palaemon carinicauda]|uniref:DNA polymerase III PolC-type-like n=1 Tax=Palaemon carinicauda TaxID=392227 RepID=UPI0035B66BF2